MTTSLKNLHTELNTLLKTDTESTELIKCYNDYEGNIASNSMCEYLKPNGDKYTYNELYNKVVTVKYNANDKREYIQDGVDLQQGIDLATQERKIITKNKEVKELRNKLDNQMREMYNPEVLDVMVDHNTGIYTTIMWTILASSVLYYLFQKLSD
jgi:hypothetical protein